MGEYRSVAFSRNISMDIFFWKDPCGFNVESERAPHGERKTIREAVAVIQAEEHHT